MHFESLANELLFDVFEYLDTVDLFQAFYGLNKRFDELLYDHLRGHQLNLQCLSKDNFNLICEKYLPSTINDIKSLRLSDDETPNLSKLFLSHSFTLNRFTCLQSLSLYCIYSLDILQNIVCQCQSLVHLNYLYITMYGNDVNKHEYSVHLLNNIWNLSNIKYCYLKGICVDERSLSKLSKVCLTMEYLTIDYVLYKLNCLNYIFTRTPNLKGINITLLCYMSNEQLTLTSDSLKSMKLFFGGSIASMNNLVKSMPNLTHLTITISQIYFDGYMLEQMIGTHLKNLKVFNLKMAIEFGDSNDNIDEMIDHLLSSFQTTFWIKEHKWYVRCHWNPSDPYKWVTLYTLPYSFDTFEFWNTCTKSTCPDEGQQWIYDRVKIFQYGRINNILLDSFSLLRARFSNIHTIDINLPFDDKFWSRFTSFNYLTTLTVVLYKYSGYFQLQTLFDRAPNLYSIKFESFIGSSMKLFELKSQSLRRIDLMNTVSNYPIYYGNEDCSTIVNSYLGRKCEVLLIRIKDRMNIIDLIEKMLKIRLLIIECEDDKECFRNNLNSKYDLFQWLNLSLPLTYTIVRDSKNKSIIKIWIDRKVTKTQSTDITIQRPNGFIHFFSTFRHLFS